jgi:uncharacterized protein (DUF885 family)
MGKSWIAAAFATIAAAAPASAQNATLGQGAPVGAVEYARLTAQFTTLPLSPDEVRAIGRAELDRVLADIATVKTELGFEGSLPEYFEHLRTDDSLNYPNTDEGCAAYIADAKRAAEQVEARLDELLEPPPGLTALDVVAIPPDLPQEIVAMYAAPGVGLSASAPTPVERGTVVLNVTDGCAAPRLRLPALAWHEGVPGHHVQTAFALAAGLRPSPEPAAYFEGWALYAEQLPCELGLCEDPYDRLSVLYSAGARAGRVLIDVRLHVDGWTRENAEAFLLANTGLSEQQARLEVDRALARPSRVSAYTIGKVKFLELRARAEAAIGDRFDLRAFHRVLLEGGPVTLPDLETAVDAWIAEQAAG